MTRSTPATPPARRRTVLGAALMASVALGVGLLSACGSGQITQTDTQVGAVPGVGVNSVDGHIALRDAVVDYADSYKPGSTVPISVRLFNNSNQSARLTGVTSNNGRFVLAGGKAQASAAAAEATSTAAPSSAAPSSAAPSTPASATGTKKPSGSASATASPSDTAAAESPSAAPSPTSAGSTDIAVPLPVGGIVVLSRNSGPYLAIDKLTGAPIEAGGALQNVVFTFTYADGSTTTITLPDLPMSPPLSPLPKPSSVVKTEAAG